MKKYEVMVILGDGIGPEVMAVTIDILKSSEAKLKFNYFEAGDCTLEKQGIALPEATLEAAKKAEVILKGPIGESAKDVVLPLRQTLDLYANIRPARNLPGIETRLKPNEVVDLVIVRENTEGLYSRKGGVKEDYAFDMKIASKRASQRIMTLGCQIAQKRKRKVSVVHKANVLKADKYFRDVCEDIGKQYSDLEIEHMYVDNCAYQLIHDPTQFDVLVMQNLFGDILSDEASWVQGGLGLSPGANLGEKQGMFEPVHGAAWTLKGKNVANPTAMILSAVMMLTWLGEKYDDKDLQDQALRIEDAVQTALMDGHKTTDVGGKLTTTKFVEKVRENLESVT